jgi:hypothetical protein
MGSHLNVGVSSLWGVGVSWRSTHASELPMYLTLELDREEDGRYRTVIG